MVRIEIPMDVGMSVRHRRKRNPTIVSVRRTFAFDVPEVASRDAPIAMWWGSRLGGGPHMAYRAIDGKLHHPVLATGTRGVDVRGGRDHVVDPPKAITGVLGAAEWARALADGWQDLPYETASIGQACAAPERPEGDVVEVVSDGTANVEESVRELVSRLSVVDGVVYRRVDAPCMTLTTTSVEISLSDHFGTFGSSPLMFGPLDFDRAVECWRRLDAVHSWRSALGVRIEDWRPRIVDRTLIPGTDLHERRVAATCRSVLDAIGGYRSGDFDAAAAFMQEPDDVMLAYARLHEANAARLDVEPSLDAFLDTPYSDRIFSRGEMEIARDLLGRPAGREATPCA